MDAKEANRRSRQGQKAAIGHEPALQAKYLQVLRANARRVSQAYTAKAAAPVTAAALVAAGGLPDDPHVPQPNLDAVLEEGVLAASATARTRAERQRIAEAAAHPIISEAGKRELKLLLQGIVAAQAGVQAERLVQGVRDTVANIMLEALVEGWTVPQTAAVLQSTLELDAEWRATMLARTDLIALSNAASLKAVSTLEEPPLYKTWLTAGDDRVRPEHVEANRQTVKVDEPYHVGGSKLMYPGDPAGPDDLVINCRCVSIFTDVPHPALEHTALGGVGDVPITQFDAPVTAGAELDALCASVLWDESRHPRHPGGEREGGRFASSSGAAIPAVPADVVGDVHDYQLEQAAAYARAHGMTPDEYLAASGEWLRGQVAGEEVRVRAPVEAIGGIVDAGGMVPGGEATFGGEWGRDRLEETYMGDGGQPPVYGYVSGIPEDDGHPVTMYGDAVIRLTPEASARSTLTLGDSANTLTDPTREAPPFAPVAFVQPSAQAIDFDTAGDVLAPGLGLRDFTGIYAETQTWGGVRLADMREVVYTDGYVPEAAVQEKLRSAGVQWRTVEGQDPVPLAPEHRPVVGQTYTHRTWLDDGAPAQMTVTGDYGTGVTWRLPGDTSDRGSSYRQFLHQAGGDVPAVTAAGNPYHEPKGSRAGGRFAHGPSAAAVATADLAADPPSPPPLDDEQAQAAGFRDAGEAQAELDLLRDTPAFAEMDDEQLLGVQQRFSQRMHGNSLSGVKGIYQMRTDAEKGYTVATPTELEEWDAVEGRYTAVNRHVNARRASAEWARTKAARAEADATGKLTVGKDELAGLLGNAGDVYVDAGHRGGYNPDLFITSDLSGKPIRHYVTLPDGRVAHPDEIHESRARGRIIVVPNVPAPKDRPRYRSSELGGSITASGWFYGVGPDGRFYSRHTGPPPVVASVLFDETKHPRYARGVREGGRFRSGAPGRMVDTRAPLTAEEEAAAAEQAAQRAREAFAARATMTGEFAGPVDDGMSVETDSPPPLPGQLELQEGVGRARGPQPLEQFKQGDKVRLSGKNEDGHVYEVTREAKPFGTKGNSTVELHNENGERRVMVGFVPATPAESATWGQPTPAVPSPTDAGATGPPPEAAPVAPVEPAPAPTPEPVPAPPPPPAAPPVTPSPAEPPPVQAPPPVTPKPVTPQVSSPRPEPGPVNPVTIKTTAIKPGEKFLDRNGNEMTMGERVPGRTRSYTYVTDHEGNTRMMRVGSSRAVFVAPDHPALAREAKTNVSAVGGGYASVFHKTPPAGNAITQAMNTASEEATAIGLQVPATPGQSVELKQTLSNTAAGQFWHTSTDAKKITVRKETDSFDRYETGPESMVSSLHHETGHFIDFSALGTRVNPYTQEYASVIRDPATMGPVMAAIDNSAAVARLEDMSGNLGAYKIVMNPGTSYEREYSADRKHVNYLRTPTEKWARAYEQYVATRSPDAGNRLKQYHADAAWEPGRTRITEDRGLSPEHAPSIRGFYGWYWSEEDFAPIADQIDQMFNRLGWRQNGGTA